MKTFNITETEQGNDIGDFQADDEKGALEAMAKDAGYDSYAEMREEGACNGTLRVTEIEGERFTLTVLNQEEGRISVLIPEEAAPLVVNEEGAEERDHGNADWPTDEEIRVAAEKAFGRKIKALGPFQEGDNLLEAVYDVEFEAA